MLIKGFTIIISWKKFNFNQELNPEPLGIQANVYTTTPFRYEGKVKSSWPSLHETWDEQLLSRDLDRSWAVIKKALHYCGDDTSSCPGPYPMATCP